MGNFNDLEDEYPLQKKRYYKKK